MNFRLIIPAVIGFLISRLCNNFSNADKNLNIVPPGYIFGIVWPILYAIIGYAWTNEYQNKYVDYIFILNTFFSGLWLYLFNCKNKKKLALYIILLIVATSIMMIQVSNKLINKILLSLYLTWLLFAMIMNSFIVNKIEINKN